MIKIIGQNTNEKVILNIKNISKATAKGIRSAMFEIGKDLRRTAKKSILAKPKHGRVYNLRKNGRLVRHRASAPGEAPAEFTGSLRRAIDFDVIGSDKVVFGVKKSFNAANKSPKGITYGKFLEFGTKKMKARPFLLPAIKDNYRNIETHLNTKIENNIKKGES